MCLRVCVCVCMCVRSHPKGKWINGEGARGTSTKSPKTTSGGWFYTKWLFLFHPTRDWEYCRWWGTFFLLTHLQTLVLILKWKCFSHVCQLSILKSGDPAVHFWGAGVLELTDSHQQWFPVHKSEADAGLWPWHHCEILHPCPPQVEKYCRVHPPQIYSFLHREAMWKTESRLTWLC